MGQVRSEVQWLAVRDAVEAAGRDHLDVVDLGGGTGTAAVRLAEAGHRVRVVDASANALAALRRRALDAQVDVVGVQGDAGEVAELFGADAADLVLCHGLLDVVDDTEQTLAAIATVLRSGGVASVVVPGLWGAVVSRLIAGDVERAAQLLEAVPGEPDVTDGDRRFTREEVVRLCVTAGLRVESVRGLSAIGWVPDESQDHDDASQARLVAFDRAAGLHEVWSQISPGLHCVARLD